MQFVIVLLSLGKTIIVFKDKIYSFVNVCNFLVNYWAIQKQTKHNRKYKKFLLW